MEGVSVATTPPHLPGEVIYRGAEATLTAATRFGRLVVVKQRRPKAYRIAELETAIARGRMRNEARLLRRAREAGVGAPAVLDADPEAQTLVLEYLGRRALRETFDTMPSRERRRGARAVGEAVGRLHKAGVIHGDLTTSNMILKGGEVYLLDFSLGQVGERLEERAVDLKAFKDSFAATHLTHAADFGLVLAGYRAVLGKAGARVVAHVGKIERRRRYA